MITPPPSQGGWWSHLVFCDLLPSSFFNKNIFYGFLFEGLSYIWTYCVEKVATETQVDRLKTEAGYGMSYFNSQIPFNTNYTICICMSGWKL